MPDDAAGASIYPVLVVVPNHAAAIPYELLPVPVPDRETLALVVQHLRSQERLRQLSRQQATSAYGLRESDQITGRGMRSAVR